MPVTFLTYLEVLQKGTQHPPPLGMSMASAFLRICVIKSGRSTRAGKKVTVLLF